MSVVDRADDGGVVTLTLNRPDKMNALTPEMVSLLRSHLESISVRADVGCVVIRGAGRCFSAGLDIAGVGAQPDVHAQIGREDGPELVDFLEGMPQTTAAALHGFCFTGALELALGCDFIVAAESTVIGDTHGKFGLVPVWGGSVRLPERVGVSNAKQIVLTGRRIDASAAQRMGLLNEVWPDADFDQEVNKFARDICANSWGSNARFKRLLSQDSNGRALRLAFERTRPWGYPEDSSARRSGGISKGGSKRSRHAEREAGGFHDDTDDAP